MFLETSASPAGSRTGQSRDAESPAEAGFHLTGDGRGRDCDCHERDGEDDELAHFFLSVFVAIDCDRRITGKIDCPHLAH
jgi:hypothetical protein